MGWYDVHFPEHVFGLLITTFSWYYTQHTLDRGGGLHHVRTFLLNRFRTNFITSSMASFGMVLSGGAVVAYLLDTHGGNGLHVLALTNSMKSIVFYGFNTFANGMIEHRGVKVSLLILAACQAACWLPSIPMYRYGKRVRAFVSH